MKNRLLFSALAAFTLLTSCGKKEQQAPPQQGPAPYPVQTVTRQDATVFEEYTANLEGRQNVEIRPKVNGFVQKIFVDEGQEVRKGQVLFQLETQTLNQDAAAAKAAVNAAQVEVDRLKPLVDRKIISNVQLETAKANLAQAKAAYGSVAANINYATVTSPVDGVIGALPFKEGALVSSTMADPLTTVSDTRVIRAYFSMNEKQMLDFTRTFEGKTLEAKLKNTPAVSLLLVDGSEFDQKGRLDAVQGLVNASTGTTQFRAEFNNPQAVLRSGSNGIVRIPVVHKNVLVVPQNAVFDMQGKQMAYVVGKDNTVKSKIVTIATTSGTNYIITEGLEEGETIVVEGTSKLKDGVAIVPEPVKEEAPAADSAAAKDTVATTVTKTTTTTTTTTKK
ncbi:efflux RND transporter periplasmic adaptor subunit [Flavobacterium akiainvivens]|uniref:efflux RND transporter periplasmic adaptor subunit n=1 Tax=Flavobacterium akiainvivens TaxID=1202724 RepID=UPI0008E44991|nr:efflux RND transporter periplasmic adaptor subunit [Flavobacterium akiainvivens]SFQ75243.1 membrane fusion protein, multidrug efflux system [Flavobacterium akiainvivens]